MKLCRSPIKQLPPQPMRYSNIGFAVSDAHIASTATKAVTLSPRYSNCSCNPLKLRKHVTPRLDLTPMQSSSGWIGLFKKCWPRGLMMNRTTGRHNYRMLWRHTALQYTSRLAIFLIFLCMVKNYAFLSTLCTLAQMTIFLLAPVKLCQPVHQPFKKPTNQPVQLSTKTKRGATNYIIGKSMDPSIKKDKRYSSTAPLYQLVNLQSCSVRGKAHTSSYKTSTMSPSELKTRWATSNW